MYWELAGQRQVSVICLVMYFGLINKRMRHVNLTLMASRGIIVALIDIRIQSMYAKQALYPRVHKDNIVMALPINL